MDKQKTNHKVGDLVLRYFPEARVGCIIKCYTKKDDYPDWMKEYYDEMQARAHYDIQWSSGYKRDVEMYENYRIEEFKRLYREYMGETQ